MKKISINFIVLIAFIGFAFTFSAPDVQVGGQAPEIELVNTEGKIIKLSSLKGKIVLVDFWASWCGPCRKENPNVVEAYTKYNKQKFTTGKGFEVMSISLDKDDAAWKKAIADDKLIWKTHGWDKDGVAARAYGAYSIPMGVLIDGKGMIIAKGAELRGLGLHIALDKMLKVKKK